MPAKKTSAPAAEEAVAPKAAKKASAKKAATVEAEAEPLKKTPAAKAPKAKAEKAEAAPEAKAKKSRVAKAAADETVGETADAVSESAPKAKKAKAAAKPAAQSAAKPEAAKTGGKRGRPAKGKKAGAEDDDADLSDIEDDLQGEPEAEAAGGAAAAAEQAKPLRMKISKAKERALMKEFGLDETVLSEEELNLRRANLKALLKLGKTRDELQGTNDRRILNRLFSEWPPLAATSSGGRGSIRSGSGTDQAGLAGAGSGSG